MCRKFLGIFCSVAVLFCFSPSTSLAELVIVSTDQGWEFSTDGM